MRVIPVLAVLLAACSSEEPTRPRGLSAAPDGFRWQGSGQQVFAVPVTWATVIAPCSAGDVDAVWYSGSHAVYDCAGGSPESSFHPQDRGCQSSVPGLCDRILSSARTLPEGWTTVPQIPIGATENEALALFEDAGLRPDLSQRANDVSMGEATYGITRTEPATGIAVRVGSRVRIFNAAGRNFRTGLTTEERHALEEAAIRFEPVRLEKLPRGSLTRDQVAARQPREHRRLDVVVPGYLSRSYAPRLVWLVISTGPAFVSGPLDRPRATAPPPTGTMWAAFDIRTGEFYGAETLDVADHTE